MSFIIKKFIEGNLVQINSINLNFQNQYKNTNFKAILPPKNVIKLEQNYWLDFYLRCKKQNKVPELQNLLEKLKNAGDGILCLLRSCGELPRFINTKNPEEVSEHLKNHKSCCYRIIKLHKNNEGYHCKAITENELEFEENLKAKDETTAILNLLEKIITKGSKENEFLFLNEAEEFLDKYR